MWNDDDDFDFNFEMSPEEEAQWKREREEKEKRRKNHPVTKQAEEVYQVVKALVASMPKEGDEDSWFAGSLMESAMIIPAKLAGAFGSESWLLSMQNAAIIRSHAEYLLTSTSGMKYENKAELQYVQLLRTEIIRFREVFVEWVKELHSMEEEDYVDEWGLFLRNPR